MLTFPVSLHWCSIQAQTSFQFSKRSRLCKGLSAGMHVVSTSMHMFLILAACTWGQSSSASSHAFYTLQNKDCNMYKARLRLY